MSSVNTTFHIPLDIEKGLLLGDYTRSGGVVRDAGGRIVTFLQEIQGPSQEAESAVKAMARSLTNSKVKVAGLVAIGVIAVAAAAYFVVVALRKRRRETELAATARRFNSSWAEYVSSVRDGRTSVENVARVLADLDDLSSKTDGDEAPISMTPQQLRELVSLAPTLSTDSVLQDRGDEKGHRAKEPENVIDLRAYLEAKHRELQQAV